MGGSLEQELKQLRKDGAKVEAQQLHSQLHELKKLYIPFHNETELEVSRLTAIITKEVGASVSFPKFKLFVEEARNEFQSRYGEPAACCKGFLDDVEWYIDWGLWK